MLVRSHALRGHRYRTDLAHQSCTAHEALLGYVAAQTHPLPKAQSNLLSHQRIHPGDAPATARPGESFLQKFVEAQEEAFASFEPQKLR